MVEGTESEIYLFKSINSAKINQYGSSYDLYYMADRAGSGKHLYTPIPGQEDAYDFLLTADNFLYANNGKPVVNGDTSFLSRNMNRTDNYQMNFTVTYNRTFGDHTLGDCSLSNVRKLKVSMLRVVSLILMNSLMVNPIR